MYVVWTKPGSVAVSKSAAAGVIVASTAIVLLCCILLLSLAKALVPTPKQGSARSKLKGAPELHPKTKAVRRPGPSSSAKIYPRAQRNK